jgi:phosphotransferase system IIB component
LDGKGHQRTRLRARFKTMDELKEFKTFAYKKIIKSQGRFDILIGEQAKDIE